MLEIEKKYLKNLLFLLFLKDHTFSTKTYFFLKMNYYFTLLTTLKLTTLKRVRTFSTKTLYFTIQIFY